MGWPAAEGDHTLGSKVFLLRDKEIPCSEGHGSSGNRGRNRGPGRKKGFPMAPEVVLKGVYPGFSQRLSRSGVKARVVVPLGGIQPHTSSELNWGDIDAKSVPTSAVPGDETLCAGNSHQKSKSKINNQDIYPKKPFVASAALMGGTYRSEGSRAET